MKSVWQLTVGPVTEGPEALKMAFGDAEAAVGAEPHAHSNAESHFPATTL